MNNSKRSLATNLRTWCVLCLLVFYPIISSANLQDEMRANFDQMIGTTNPGHFDSQKRHSFSGGNFSMRSRVIQPNLFAVKAPSFSAGCNGIDINLGAISFISDPAELVRYLRAVANGVEGYAFSLAIKAMCPTCASTMAELQQKINEWGRMFKDSCTAAKNIVDGKGIGSVFTEKYQTAWNEMSSAGGADSYKGRTTDTNVIEDMVTGPLGPDSANQESQNVVWDALNANNVSGWYPPSTTDTDEVKRVLMSYSGTLVVTYDEATAVPGWEWEVTQKPPLLSFNDIYNGTGTDTKKLYICPGAATRQTKCLDIVEDPGPGIRIVGIKSMVREMIFGDQSSSGGFDGIVSVGIIQKTRNPTSVFNVNEESFIKSSALPVYKMLRDLAIDSGAASALGEALTDTIALELAVKMSTDSLKVINYAIAATDNTSLSAKFLEHLKERKKEVGLAQGKAGDALKKATNIYDSYKVLIGLVRHKDMDVLLRSANSTSVSPR